MYAETFNVRAWLEDPAKWLRWAQQSLAERNLDNTRYNLQQFWASLAAYKGKASQAKDWGEVLTLDSQSQLILGNLYGADLNELLQTMSTTRMVSSSVYALKESDYQAKQKALTEGRDQALAASRDLAAQASQAYQQANVPATQQQAGNTLTVATYSKDRAKQDAAAESSMAQRITREGVKITDLLTTNFMGVPGWAWLAGGVALLLILTTGPSAAQAYAVRRAMED
ncbi:MAG TPA: hypothetical protein VJ549_00500 [Geothrix sp.]|nr:hypothetical protein [Geothrix sp.]HJV47727.1 hypothetical protein [Geothrix sp.]